MKNTPFDTKAPFEMTNQELYDELCDSYNRTEEYKEAIKRIFATVVLKRDLQLAENIQR